MKDMLETLSCLLLVVAVFALVFVFQGEPDLWDRWHAKAMGEQCAAAGKPAP